MFRVSKTLYIVMIVLASLLAAACNDDSKNTDSEVLAKVGSSNITLKQVDSVIKQQIGTGGPAFTSTELAAARLSVLDNLIQEEALFQLAQKGENLVPDDNKVNQEIQKTKQDAGLTEEKYQESLKQAGLTEADVKERVKKQLAINALRDREKARVTAPTDAEIEKYFNDNRAQFVAARGVDLSIIVADPTNNGAVDDAMSEAQAEQKINAIYGQLKSGADFATVASQRSEHQSAMRQGSAGFATEEQLRQQLPTHPEVVQRLMTMSPGQYTEPIKEAGSVGHIQGERQARSGAESHARRPGRPQDNTRRHHAAAAGRSAQRAATESHVGSGHKELPGRANSRKPEDHSGDSTFGPAETEQRSQPAAAAAAAAI